GDHQAEDHALSLVRYRGRAGGKILLLSLQGLKARQNQPLHRSRSRGSPQAGGFCDGCRIRDRGTDLHCAERRPELQVQRGNLAAGALRDAGRGGLLLEQAHPGRRRGTVRLAQGQIRRVVAGRAGQYPEDDDRSGSQKIRARHERIPENEEARHRRDRARLLGLKMTAARKKAPYGEASLTLKRVFDAPRALVWKAWTDPKMMEQWFGPRGFTIPVCELDVCKGGSLRIVMRGPDGADYPMKGVFLSVTEPERLVFT